MRTASHGIFAHMNISEISISDCKYSYANGSYLCLSRVKNVIVTIIRLRTALELLAVVD